MPISYSIDSQRHLIFEVWAGVVSASDLAEYWRAYLADPEVLAIRRTLVDLRDSQLAFSGRDLADLVTTIVTPVLKGRTWTTAIVVTESVQFGVSRQYQVFAESYSHDAIFYDYDLALQWLLQQPYH